MQNTLNDLSTPNEITMQVEVLSKYGYPPDRQLEENWDLLLDKTKKHTNAKKRELMEIVIDQLYYHHSSFKSTIVKNAIGTVLFHLEQCFQFLKLAHYHTTFLEELQRM